MKVCSEKLIYQDCFEDLFNKTHQDLFLWGEDLADKRLIPYAGKLKDLPAYDSFCFYSPACSKTICSTTLLT